MSSTEPSQGGEPQAVAECTACSAIFPAQVTGDGGLRPIGLEDGTCTCGNVEFQSIIEA
ncbi:uncharacterized protein HHUB_1897 [Halobacterium hubeiense]|uniref:Uncharacterized protein n=2 Tax=Halobacterium TaxID=2239 RepID=A0A0U5H1K3_9EURY|nr:hypothetical protein [Halobacterium hubeiense]CQH52888.1 uncharacterized protein HHUB_1897 [Halobacterium hubeiense]